MEKRVEKERAASQCPGEEFRAFPDGLYKTVSRNLEEVSPSSAAVAPLFCRMPAIFATLSIGSIKQCFNLEAGYESAPLRGSRFDQRRNVDPPL